MLEELSDSMVASIQLAAKSMCGHQRRLFQAEMTLKYCEGSARKAERRFGWRRSTVDTGLNELRSGIQCFDNFSARGRKKTEECNPQVTAKVHQIVEPRAQADPKFQTSLAFTRITATRVRQELLKDVEVQDVVPSRQTVGAILNRLGYSLRRVQKTRPEKKSPKQI